MSWSVTKLTIQANTAGGAADKVYANGYMQVPIDVTVTAVKPDGGSYYLTDPELDKIQLVDYNDVDNELSGQWKYTEKENEFGHTIEGGGGFAHSGTENPAPTHGGSGVPPPGSVSHGGSSSAQTKRYWVSTTAITNQKIGAAITEPSGNYYHTHSKKDDNFVTITGLSPIVYNTGNVRVTRDDNDTTSGSYGTTIDISLGVINKKISIDLPWKAQNYQLSIDRGLIKKAEIYGHRSTSDGFNYSIKYQTYDTNHLAIFYVWPLGPQQDRQIIFNLDKTVPNGKAVVNVHTTVPTNNRRGSLCFTRVQYIGNEFSGPQVWGSSSTEKASCKIYDEWGNSGQFRIVISGDQNVAIVDTN